MINYKTLLLKYMEHVGDCEGTDFVDWLNSYRSAVLFSADEQAALENISKKIEEGR
jgi:hypothetical protein